MPWRLEDPNGFIVAGNFYGLPYTSQPSNFLKS